MTSPLLRRDRPDSSAALALNLTGYYGLAASMFALPDGPLLFFWLLTLDRLSLALDERRTADSAYWVQAGFAWGGAMLSKYHAIFIPMGVGLLCCSTRGGGAGCSSPAPTWRWRSGWRCSARS